MYAVINKGKIVADDKLSELQGRSTTNLVKVSFREPLEAEWLNRLNAVSSVHKINAQTWNIETDDPQLVRKQLLELSLQHNLNIVSLQNENQSLEEIFRTLTDTTTAKSV